MNMPHKKPSTASVFFIMAAFAGIFLVGTLLVFMLNVRSEKPGAVTGQKSFQALVASENAKETQRLYKISDEYAFLVDGTYIATVHYEKSAYPFAFACGSYTYVGNSVGYPLQQGDYLFSTYPNAENRYAVFNVKTEEYTTVASLSDVAGVQLDPVQATAITAEDIFSTYERLPLQKESCLTVTVAEVIVIFLFAGIGGIFVFVQYARTRRQKSVL